jgi:DNA-binding PadR family transcriptional regulator
MSANDESQATRKPWRARRSTLGLIVLWQLFEGPNHVYGLQKQLKQQGKDRVVNVRARASLYQSLDRLQRLGLVEVRETVRREGYPDRIVYAITDAGREAAREWLRGTLREAGGEYPEFIAALSIVFGLAPDDARAQLEQRAKSLARELADAEAQLESTSGLPRLFLLEEEYRRAVLAAELSWLRGVIADLEERRLTWSDEWLREIADAFMPARRNSNDRDQRSSRPPRPLHTSEQLHDTHKD